MDDTNKRQGTISFLLEMIGGFIGSIFLVFIFVFMLCGVSDKRFYGERKEPKNPMATWLKAAIGLCVIAFLVPLLADGEKPIDKVEVVTEVTTANPNIPHGKEAFCFSGPDGKGGTMVAMDDETVVLRSPEGKLVTFARADARTVSC